MVSRVIVCTAVEKLLLEIGNNTRACSIHRAQRSQMQSARVRSILSCACGLLASCTIRHTQKPNQLRDLEKFKEHRIEIPTCSATCISRALQVEMNNGQVQEAAEEARPYKIALYSCRMFMPVFPCLNTAWPSDLPIEYALCTEGYPGSILESPLSHIRSFIIEEAYYWQPS